MSRSTEDTRLHLHQLDMWDQAIIRELLQNLKVMYF